MLFRSPFRVRFRVRVQGGVRVGRRVWVRVRVRVSVRVRARFRVRVRIRVRARVRVAVRVRVRVRVRVGYGSPYICHQGPLHRDSVSHRQTPDQSYDPLPSPISTQPLPSTLALSTTIYIAEPPSLPPSCDMSNQGQNYLSHSWEPSVVPQGK